MRGKTQNQDWDRDVNYLLGGMNEAEREALRAELLTGGDAFDRLREAENDLFDAYAGGTLTAEQRAAFERTLLRQPGAAAKLRASRLLMSRQARSRSRWWFLPAAVAAGVSVFFIRNLPPRKEPPQPTPVVARVAAQSFRLMAATRGAGAVPELVVLPGTEEIEFVAEVPAGPRLTEYPVAMERSAGAVVWSGVVTPVGGELRWRVDVPAAGSYVIRLGSATEPLGFFEVRVVRP